MSRTRLRLLSCLLLAPLFSSCAGPGAGGEDENAPGVAAISSPLTFSTNHFTSTARLVGTTSSLFAVWMATTSTGPQVVGQLFTTAGVPTVPVRAYSAGANPKWGPVVRSNGSGTGFLIAYSEQRSDGNIDVKATFVNSDGTPGLALDVDASAANDSVAGLAWVDGYNKFYVVYNRIGSSPQIMATTVDLNGFVPAPTTLSTSFFVANDVDAGQGNVTVMTTYNINGGTFVDRFQIQPAVSGAVRASVDLGPGSAPAVVYNPDLGKFAFAFLHHTLNDDEVMFGEFPASCTTAACPGKSLVAAAVTRNQIGATTFGSPALAAAGTNFVGTLGVISPTTKGLTSFSAGSDAFVSTIHPSALAAPCFDNNLPHSFEGTTVGTQAIFIDQQKCSNANGFMGLVLNTWSGREKTFIISD
jgi:hypothetical protein